MIGKTQWETNVSACDPASGWGGGPHRGVDCYNIGLRAWRDPSGVEKQPHSSSMAAY